MSLKMLEQKIENVISWFTFTGKKMKFNDIVNKFIEREAISSSFLWKVTVHPYLVVQCNPVRQASGTQNWLDFWKIQPSITFPFRSLFKIIKMFKIPDMHLSL